MPAPECRRCDLVSLFSRFRDLIGWKSVVGNVRAKHWTLMGSRFGNWRHNRERPMRWSDPKSASNCNPKGACPAETMTRTGETPCESRAGRRAVQRPRRSGAFHPSRVGGWCGSEPPPPPKKGLCNSNRPPISDPFENFHFFPDQKFSDVGGWGGQADEPRLPCPPPPPARERYAVARS